jgi:hypothetical protein
MSNMKKEITTFARGILYLVVLAALAVCFVLLPELAREEAVGKEMNPYMTYLFFAIAYIIATPFFIALYQTHKLLKYIDKKKAFSVESIKTLRTIKMCAIAFGIFVVLSVIAGLSIAKHVDPTEEVTFIVTIGFLLTLVASILAIFVAVLQKLLGDAVALKSENDLIV